MVVNLHVGSSVHVSQMGHAVKNTVGVQNFARTVFEVVIVQKASVAAANVHALLLTGNAILMFAETAGLGVVMVHWEFQTREEIIMNAGT